MSTPAEEVASVCKSCVGKIGERRVVPIGSERRSFRDVARAAKRSGSSLHGRSRKGPAVAVFVCAFCHGGSDGNNRRRTRAAHPTQASYILNVSPQRVRQLMAEGRLTHVITPLGRLLDRGAVERFAVKRALVASAGNGR